MPYRRANNDSIYQNIARQRRTNVNEENKKLAKRKGMKGMSS